MPEQKCFRFHLHGLHSCTFVFTLLSYIRFGTPAGQAFMFCCGQRAEPCGGSLTVWNLLYFAVGFCSVCVFCFFTNGLSCFTILPHDVLPCDALTCLLPFGFALAISLLAFCLCIFCSFVWGQVFAISCLVAVSFTEFPSPFLCYAMLIRCRAMSPAGFDERAGLLFYLIFAGIVCFIGMFLFLQLDLFPGLQRRPQ